MSDLHVEYLPLSALLPYARNSRTHSEEQIAQIAASIKEFGFTNPILVSEDADIIAGHGRALAAHKLQLADVPCIRLGHLSETQRKAYVIADNRLALNAGWDMSMLSLELSELKTADFDLDLLGFGEDELDALSNPEKAPGEGLTDPDAVPEVTETRCKPGDLWVMGGHRLLCGDSTNIQHVERLMGGERASLFATDPPYGINHVAVSQEKGQSKGYAKIANDELQDQALQDFLFSVLSTAIATACAPNFAFYMWHAMKMQAYTAAAAAAAAGILFHRQIIWVKPRFVFGRGHYHWRHELCLMGWLQGNEPPFYGQRNQSSVWEIGRENDKIHPTQKPVRISEIPMENHTRPGEVCYEPFSGSGSQLIAAEKLGRRCFGLELEPTYCDVILFRWEKFTGKQATLEASNG